MPVITINSFAIVVLILALTLGFCGEPDLVDGAIYNATGFKSWEQDDE